jgi:hypothetical protein
MAKIRLPLLITGIFVLLTACQAGPTIIEAPTTIPTKVITPTETLWPTITAALTATPPPPTPTIEPDIILQEYFNNPQIKRTDSFSDLNSWLVWDEDSVSLDNGQVTLVGQPDWNSALVFNTPILENQGIVLNFKTLNNLDSKSEFVFISGEFQTADFLQFGMYNGPTPKADLYQGSSIIGYAYLHGNYTIRKDAWQTLVMAVDDQGNFLAVVFDPQNPSNRFYYLEEPGEKWKNREWNFRITATKAESIHVKDFQLFVFSEILN